MTRSGNGRLHYLPVTSLRWIQDGGHSQKLQHIPIYQPKGEELSQKSGYSRMGRTTRGHGSQTKGMEILRKVWLACTDLGQKEEHGMSGYSGRFCGILSYLWSFV